MSRTGTYLSFPNNSAGNALNSTTFASFQTMVQQIPGAVSDQFGDSFVKIENPEYVGKFITSIAPPFQSPIH